MSAMTPTMIGQDQPLCTCGTEGEHSLFEHDRKIIQANTVKPDVTMNLDNRHPATRQILRWFAADHLPQGRLRRTSSIIANHAHYLAATLPDGPELSAGLRKMLEAKDCFVRAAIDATPQGTEGSLTT